MKLHINILVIIDLTFFAMSFNTNAEETKVIVNIVSEDKPAPINLHHRFVGENKPNGRYLKSKYLSEEESKELVLVMANGLLLTLKGEKFDTTGMSNDMGLFVIDTNGTIYSSRNEDLEFTHSSYVAGKPVMCAGYWHVVDGDIQVINDRSKRYVTLDHKNLDWCMDFLKKEGMDFTGVPVFYSSEEI